MPNPYGIECRLKQEAKKRWLEHKQFAAQSAFAKSLWHNAHMKTEPKKQWRRHLLITNTFAKLYIGPATNLWPVLVS